LQGSLAADSNAARDAFFPSNIGFSLPFAVESECVGFLGLGVKLIKEPFNENDRELLDTLVNNLVVALKNARFFEEIKDLNEELQAKNIQLEKTLDDLKKALRKVEILEDVKSNLSKFVPNTVTRLIEKSPNGLIPKSREQDVSVLFLDIEGYTKMCEQLDRADVSEVIEKCFSVFMDAIFANNGDVNETAGDGLMVVFLNAQKTTNALEAVRTALKIREEAARIKNEFKGLSEPLTINMGINSGPALVGAAKFDSITGSRWTYTARGLVTNVAARIGAQASNGQVFLSKATAERVKDQFSLTPLGKFNLKNVSKEIEIFEL
jgi:class 3 adenylate cyclase